MALDVGGAFAAEPPGATLYRRHCARCHGVSADGRGSAAPLFATPPRDLRHGVLDRHSVLELTRRIRQGTPLALDRDLGGLTARTGEVAALVAHLRRLPTINWTRVRPALELWIDRCESCHGAYGKPAADDGGRLPDLSRDLNLGDVSGDALLARLRHWDRRATRNGPPAISRDEARAIRPHAELLSPGMEIYGRYCAVCHGDDGWPPERGLGGPEGPTVLLNRQYMEAHDDTAIAARVWHMLAEQQPRMPHLGTRVSDADVGTIVRYLRARYR